MLIFSVTATMEGYVVTGPDAKGIFLAQKLAEIYVAVLDEADKKALQVCNKEITFLIIKCVGLILSFRSH